MPSSWPARRVVAGREPGKHLGRGFAYRFGALTLTFVVAPTYSAFAAVTG